MQFSIGTMFVIVTLVALFLGWSVRRQPVQDAPFTAAEIDALVAYIQGPPKSVSFVNNIQVPAAIRLGELSPQQATQHGAIPALQTLIANTNDTEAKKAAERAVRRINGR